MLITSIKIKINHEPLLKKKINKETEMSKVMWLKTGTYLARLKHDEQLQFLSSLKAFALGCLYLQLHFHLK